MSYGKTGTTDTDHVSVLKFIERNWDLAPLSARSLDNLPNPVQTDSNPYIPTNSPAIGDMFDHFDFGHHATSFAALRARGGQRTRTAVERFLNVQR